MKQQPSRLKYRKNHKLSSSFLLLKAHKTFLPSYGRFALKSLSATKLTFANIEAARKSIRRNVEKSSKIFIRLFTGFSVTRKPIAVRMGSGKGQHAFWMCPVRAGQILFEIVGPANSSKKALLRASRKLSCKCCVVSVCF
jgi:large subunit ribosomal protein L16